MLPLHHHGSINIRCSFPHGLFSDWEGGGCRKFVPVLGGDGTKLAPIRDIFNQASGELSVIRGKLADYIEDHAVLSPEGANLMTPRGWICRIHAPPPNRMKWAC